MTSSDQPDSFEDTPSVSVPWYRNPWVWGVIAGLIFVPAIRPFTRHIPDAPPLLTELPEFELKLSNGGRAKSSELRGRVYVLGFHGVVCEPDCGEVLPALRSLSDRFKQFDREITVLAVHLGEADDATLLANDAVPDLASPWLMSVASVESLAPLARQGLLPHLDPGTEAGVGIPDVARRARLFLVDAFGNLRGHYAIDESGLDEVYHRAQHVRRDHKIDGLL